MITPPGELVIDSEPYQLLKLGGGRVQWNTEQVPTQPGDGGVAKPHTLYWHAGMGVSRRYSQGPQQGQGHHEYSENMWLGTDGVIQVAPKITYLDVSGKSGDGKAFVLGGFKRSRLGGATTAGLGGGEYGDAPQWIEQFGDALYVLAGTHTYKIDPTVATPTLDETRNHGTGARARSGDVFDNQLVVALGSNVDAEVATSPAGTTVWSTASSVQMSVYRVGSSGRLFSAKDNLVFSVASGQDPTTSGNYVPTAGEVISDETDPVRGIAEYLRGLVAGTASTLRTLDPDSGYIDRPLLPKSRLSASDYDGRAILTVGQTLFFAQTRAVTMFRAGLRPIAVGLEQLEQNESPYIGPEYGVPDWAGTYALWPVFFSSSGDSVIFHVRERREGEPGIGLLRWMPLLFLENVECRVVKFWGGTATRKPRAFFGGSTTSNPEIVGNVDLGDSGGDGDIFASDASPAVLGTVWGPDDDFGLPNTIKEVERIEMPEVKNADASNYAVWSVADDGGTDYKDLVREQGVTLGERIDATGAQTVYAQTGDVPAGEKLKFRLVITQAAAASSFFQLRGYSTAYITERPKVTDQVTTLLDVQTTDFADAVELADRLGAHVPGPKVQVEGDDGDDRPWVKFSGVRAVRVEVRDADGRNANMRNAVEIVFREVKVG